MARVCICGCGKELLLKDGSGTDYDRFFFEADCRNRDKAQRMRDMRARAKKKTRCSTCGQPMPNNKKARA